MEGGGQRHMLLALFSILLVTTTERTQASCAYEVCYTGEKDQLNIHIIPHSHDDVGWVRTVQEYYDSDVESILDTTVQQLIANSTYRFVYAEMAYFTKWWSKQNGKTKDDVRQLVSKGRLQFVQGGWSMADEATVYYGDEINQLTRGRAFLKEEFGECGIPKVAWQIDTFGHSRDRAGLFYDAVYDGLVFQRMDYMEKMQRRRNKTMELLWEVGAHKNLFTHVMYDSYCYPKDVGLDSKIGLSHTYESMKQTAQTFHSLLKEYAKVYRFNHFMVPMGCDFTYTKAPLNFQAMDQLIGEVQGSTVDDKKINVFYSTPACYLKAINEEFQRSEQPFPIRRGDFFPYADRAHNYWTGFYTSRPAFKSLVRKSSNLLTVAEQLKALVGIPQPSKILDNLRQQMGIMQHHDAVTGTEKEYVTADYIARLLTASRPVEKLISISLSKLLKQTVDLKFCNLRNESQCLPTMVEKLPKQFAVLIYNPLSWPITSHWERIPLGQKLSSPIVAHIQDADGEELKNQIVDSLHGTKELIFSPTSDGRVIPALGFTTYSVYIHRLKPDHINVLGMDDLYKNERFSYGLEIASNSIVVLAMHQRTGEQYRIRIQPKFYFGESTGNEVSGAYVFRPNVKESIHNFQEPVFKVSKGPCVTQIGATYEDWVTLTVSSYSDGRIEVDWLVGSVPAAYKYNATEVVLRYTTEAINGIRPCHSGEFYTDSDGRTLIKRTRNLNFEDPSDRIAANYYPVVNRILLKGCSSPQSDSDLVMAVYTDRPEGGTSLEDGQIELMLFRRLLVDDNLGVDEALLDDGPVRGLHRLIFDEWNSVMTQDRKFATEIVKPPTTLFELGKKLPANKGWSALNMPLPDNIHLMNLVSWPLTTSSGPSQFKHLLIRFENFASGSVPLNNLQAINLTHLLKGMLIYTASEMTLTADQRKINAELERLQWTSNDRGGRTSDCLKVEGDDLNVLIQSEEIITLLAEYIRI